MSHGNVIILTSTLLGYFTIWKCSTTHSFRFSPGLLFFTVLFLQQVMGFMVIVDESDPLDRLGRLGITLGILGFSAGTIAATFWARFSPSRELADVRERYDFAEPLLRYKIAIMLVGYVLSIVIMALFFRSGGGIPLLQGLGALAGGEEVLSAQILLKERRMELTYFEGSSYRGQGYIDQIRMQVLPYLVACFVVWATVVKKWWVTLLALGALSPVVLFLAGTGQRHPTLSFILSMTVLSYVLTSPEKHKRVMIGFFFVGLLLFAAMTYFLGRYTHTGAFRSDISMVFLGIWYRILYSNSINTMSLFHLFPNPEPFRWGFTWINDLTGFLPGPHVGFSAWLYERLNGHTGTASPMCFGEMFANFGLPGIFFGGAILGMILQTGQVFWARMRRYRAEHLVLYAILSMGMARMGTGGLLGPIQFGLVALPLLYVVIQLGRDAIIVLGKRRWYAPHQRGRAHRLPEARV